MRNSKSLKINQRLSCTAFELSVGQILSLLFATAHLTLPDDLEVFYAEISERVFNDAEYFRWNNAALAKKLSDAEKQMAIAFFYDVNVSFFNPKLSKAEEIKQQKREKLGLKQVMSVAESYEAIAIEIGIYTRWGHVQILTYPWSLFVQVRKQFEQWAEKNG